MKRDRERKRDGKEWCLYIMHHLRILISTFLLAFTWVTHDVAYITLSLSPLTLFQSFLIPSLSFDRSMILRLASWSRRFLFFFYFLASGYRRAHMSRVHAGTHLCVRGRKLRINRSVEIIYTGYRELLLYIPLIFS